MVQPSGQGGHHAHNLLIGQFSFLPSLSLLSLATDVGLEIRHALQGYGSVFEGQHGFCVPDGMAGAGSSHLTFTPGTSSEQWQMDENSAAAALETSQM